MAFSSSHAQEANKSIAETAERLKPDPDWSWVLGALTAGSELIGLLGFDRVRGPKECHKARLWGFYVALPYRRTGVGRALVDQCLIRARGIAGLRQVKLFVNPTQQAAVQLYSSFGFQSFGRESEALKIDGRFFDEDYMVLRLPDHR